MNCESKSKPSKCYCCDTFSHSKPSCFNKGVESPQFYCKVYAPVSETPPTSKDTSNQFIGMTKTDNGWKCDKCQFKVKIRYSMKRHLDRKHADQVHSESIVVTNETLVSEVSLANVVTKVPASIEQLMDNLELKIYKEIFAKEIIDLKMLLELKAS